MLREMTTMEIMSGGRKIQEHPSPLFPCSAYYTRWQRGGWLGVPWHWHRELELMTVAEGSARVCFAGESEVLSAGDGYFCNANVLHSIQMEGCPRCSVHSLVFSQDIISGGDGTVFNKKYVEPVTDSAGFPGMILRASVPWQKDILDLIEHAHRLCSSEPEGFELLVRRELSDIWLLIFKNCKTAFAAPPPENLQDTRRIKAMLSFIQRRYPEPITVEDIARSANICIRECHRCFSRTLRVSPAACLQAYRIQMASIMLRDTDMSILDVGLSVGFSNPSHFSKIFKKYTGVTPGHYRRRGTPEGGNDSNVLQRC